MKLILAIIPDHDNEPVSQALISQGFRVTQIASSGGFLRRGSVTLVVGVEDARVDEAARLIRETCAPLAEPGDKRAVMFVLNVAEFSQI
jgi:uncharacterized protein YaaQ